MVPTMATEPGGWPDGSCARLCRLDSERSAPASDAAPALTHPPQATTMPATDLCRLSASEVVALTTSGKLSVED